MPSLPSTLRPKALVGVGAVVLAACVLPLVRVVTSGDANWLWLLLLTARRAAVTAVATSALAVVVVGVVWWVDETWHTERTRAKTTWLADVGPSTSTWAPRWVTFAGLGFVALGFVLVFASGGERAGEAPLGAPEAVAPVFSLVRLVGGMLVLAAPGTILGGVFWWVTRYQAGRRAAVAPGSTAQHDVGQTSAAQTSTVPTSAGRAGGEGASTDEAGAGQTDTEQTEQAVPARARTLAESLTTAGRSGHPVRLVAVGAVLAVLGAVVAVVADVAGDLRPDFPGSGTATPVGGLLRCCAFVGDGTALTTWFLVGVLLLWAGLTAVAVGVSWWDTERQAQRPDTPQWVAGLAPDPSEPLARDFPPTGAPPEPDGPAREASAQTAPSEGLGTARWLVFGGLVAVVVGVLLTAGLRTDRAGTTLYVYDAGPALLGLVFLLPVGLALVVSGSLWWSQRRRESTRTRTPVEDADEDRPQVLSAPVGEPSASED